MMRSLMLVAVTGMILCAGCKPRPAPETTERVPAPEAHAPRAAVLYFEELADRAPGGLSVHADQLEGLAAALRERKIHAVVHLVPADDPAPRIPASFDAAILVDVPSLRGEESAMLDAFAREGGLLLAIGPHAHAEALFGVRADGDEPVARDGLARVVRGGAPFPDDLAETLNWGPLSAMRWPVRAESAAVRVADSDGAPLLTERTIGSGTAWYCAVLPPGRRFNGWASAPDAVSTLASIVQSAPARGRDAEPPPLRVDLAVNTVAFGEGQWPARAIVRVRGGAEDAPLSGTFEVRGAEDAAALKGALQPLPARWRSRFLVADLSKLPAGEYEITAHVPPADPVTASIQRSTPLLDAAIADSLAAWLDALDLAPPSDDTPVSARDIEDRALLAWALARSREIPGTPERYRYDLERVAYWFRAAGTRIFPDPAAPASALGAMAAGLARAVDPIRRDASMHLAREIQLLAEQAYGLLAARPGDDLAAIGARLWAAAELHRATQITDYRAAADAAARTLFARQLDRGRSVEGDVFGDFFMDANRTTLPPPDGGRARSVGFLLGLVALENIAEPGSFKIDLGAVLDRFSRGYLLGGAALNPYGAFPAGLEPAEPPKPRPDGRGMAGPEKIRTRAYAREADDAEPGVEATRLALAVVAMERHLVTGEVSLRRAAKDQINHLLGLNPEGQRLWREGAVLNGIIGRGPDRVPVWRPAYSESGDAMPGAIWLLVLHALLTGGRP